MTGKDRVKTGKILLPVRLYGSNGVPFTFLGQEDRLYILIMSYLKESERLLLCNLFSNEFASNLVLAVHMLTVSTMVSGVFDLCPTLSSCPLTI